MTVANVDKEGRLARVPVATMIHKEEKEGMMGHGPVLCDVGQGLTMCALPTSAANEAVVKGTLFHGVSAWGNEVQTDEDLYTMEGLEL